MTGSFLPILCFHRASFQKTRTDLYLTSLHRFFCSSALFFSLSLSVCEIQSHYLVTACMSMFFNTTQTHIQFSNLVRVFLLFLERLSSPFHTRASLGVASRQPLNSQLERRHSDTGSLPKSKVHSTSSKLVNYLNQLEAS